MRYPIGGWPRLVVAVAALAAAPGLRAAAPFSWGVQAGLQAPLQSDLRVTTGGLGPAAGVHGDWSLRPGQTLRCRLDLGVFPGADQASTAPPFQQNLHTRVRDLAAGAEYLCRPAALGGAWSFGPGAYLIRWTVASTETLAVPAGAFPVSGSSSWTREGLGAVGAYRWTAHLETELRVIFSHYGYKNQPARLASLNVLLHF